MDNRVIAEVVKASMSSRRYKHTIGVAETAVKLAALYRADSNKAETAALLHDIARETGDIEMLELCRERNIEVDEIEKNTAGLLHGKVAASIAHERFGVSDEEVLDAIRFHTTGRRHMTLLEKIIFIADMVEPGRNFPGVEELRQLAIKDLDRAVVAGIDSTIRFVIERGLVIHPKSIEARNTLLGYGGKTQ